MGYTLTCRRIYNHRVLPRSRSMHLILKLPAGFTLVELIIVMVIIGIISVVAIPRFFERSNFEARGFYDAAQAALRYAQKQAIAQRRPVAVGVDTASATITLCYNNPPPCVVAGANPPVLHPASFVNYVVAPPNTGYVMASSNPSYVFLGSGQLNVGGTIDIAADGTTRTICLEAVTGYVHPPRTLPNTC